MPSQLITARIRGIRSYSPRTDKTQSIDFMPLTLIVGKNGTGKTTIIESLKFIIAGEEPPHSDSRRNFIHNSRKGFAAISEDHNWASVEIEFKNTKNELCLARREISQAGAFARNSTPAVSSAYKINNGSWININRLDDWSKVMPKLFGLPNDAILSHVILCHQDDNLWCMSDSSNVKQIFDRIFGCEQYKKEIKYIDEEIKACKKDIELVMKDLERHRDQLTRKRALITDMERVQYELSQNQLKVEALEVEIVELIEQKKVLIEALKERESSEKQLQSCKQRVKELTERDQVLRSSMEPLLNRSRSKPERRPPPPLLTARFRKKKNKPEQDPTAIELEFVSSKIVDMNQLVSKMPVSDDLSELKKLVNEVGRKIDEIKEKFWVRIEEEEKEDETEDELQRKWYEQQEAASREAEARRLEEDKKVLQSIEANIQSIEEELIEATKRLVEMEANAEAQRLVSEEKVEELKSIEQKIMSARDRKSMVAGSCLQLERELSKLKAEERSYWRADINYAESLGSSVCNKIVLNDCEKLKKCFTESVSQFHDQMILRINEALRSRWRQIYQGTDIESIEVVAEEVTRAKTKSFNYYIAMSKSGTRMKMRDKGSAGQRALASIILRTTLAELFVQEFTFIALDEPTANLDLPNVQALAKSIGAYVRNRTMKGANIQWIIITHDEEFLKALDEESSPFFYRIKMDGEGYSNITKVSSRDNLNEERSSEENGARIKF